MRSVLCAAIAAMLLQGCIICAPCTVAWRSNSSQQVADTEGQNRKAEDANSVNADKKTDVSASVPQSKSVAKTVIEKLAKKVTGKNSSDEKTTSASDDDDCPECRN